MNIAFHGAARTVTGSKHLVTLQNGTKILLDCGMFQGMGKETADFNSDFGFEPSAVHHLILSHAHIDHCGLIPKLVKEGFKGVIYCTPATKELATVLLQDSAFIQESDVRYQNKLRAREHKTALSPLYSVADANEALEQFETVNYNEWHPLQDGVSFCFTDAGHIIGSAAVHLRYEEAGQKKQLTFSGDVGRYTDALLRAPAAFEQADYIILESTYGDTLHNTHNPTPDALLRWIETTCLQKKGKLILPAFSVGRTQEILLALNQLELENRLPNLQYFVDSPLSLKATNIVKKYPAYFNENIQNVLETDKDPFQFNGLKFVASADESKSLNYIKGPCVIISSSGMGDAGRVKHHISNTIENSRNSIVFTGYCEPSSLGGRLKLKPKEVHIFGQEHEVNAEIGELRSMSAHGDYEDLMQFIGNQDKALLQKIFLVHGEYGVQQHFKQKLEQNGFESVHIPALHQNFTLGES